MTTRGHHHAGRVTRTIHGIGALLAAAFLITQVLVVLAAPAAGDPRSRDGAFESDTTVISDGSGDQDAGSDGISTRTAPASSPADDGEPPPDEEPPPCDPQSGRLVDRRCEEEDGGISIDKDANVEGSVGLYEEFSFTITLTNTGGYGELVHVSDPIPPGLVLLGSSCGYEPRLRGLRQTGIQNGDQQSVECTVWVDPEGPTTITVWVFADGSECHPVNTASFEVLDEETSARAHATATGDGTSGSASADVHVECPRIDIDKSVDVTGELAPGDDFHYTITISNGGNGEGYEFFGLFDPFPYGITVTDVTSSAEGEQLICYEPDQSAQPYGLSCYGFIGEGETITIVITAYANGQACGRIDNTAYLMFGEQPSGAVTGVDESPFSEQDSASIFVRCLYIEKDASTDLIEPFGSFSYTITVSNEGEWARYGLEISDALPAGLALDGIDVSDPQNVSCEAQGTVVHCTIDELWGGSSVWVTIHVHHLDGCSFRNQATLSGGEQIEERATQDESDPPQTELPATAAAEVSVVCAGEPGPPPPPPPGEPDLELSKEGPETAHVGDTITYTFTVTVANEVPVTDVTVQDPQCDADPVLVSKLGGDDDDTLEPDETWVFECTHLVTAEDPDPLVNTATATAEGGGVVASAVDSASTDILHPGIDVEITPDPDQGEPGEGISFTFVVTNTGDTPLTDVTLDDELFDDFGQQGSGRTVLAAASSLPDLASGESVSFTRSATLSGGTDLKDTADASGTDPGGATVTDRDRVSVDLVLGRTVTPTKTPPGGIAFTGSSAAVPLGVLALLSFVVGTGLLWISRRLRHKPAHAGRRP